MKKSLLRATGLTLFILANAARCGISSDGMSNSTLRYGTALTSPTKLRTSARPLLTFRVTRNSRTIDATLGTLEIGNTVTGNTFKCDTIENPAFLIPSGSYPLILTYSPRFHRILPLILVPHNSGIRIHEGHVPFRLRGCIAVDSEALETIIHQLQGQLSAGGEAQISVS
jgi:Family of unknown function (DUF5675)